MADTAIPARPETDERTGPEMTMTLGGSSVWDQSAAWMDDLGGDPRAQRGHSATIRLFEATLGDPKVRAVLDQRLDAGTAAALEIEPGGSMRRDRMAAEDLADQIGGLEIDRITRELLHAIWYGYGVAECIWEIEGARVRLRDLRVRDPRVIRWDHLTRAPLLLTRANPAGIPLPPAKFVLLTNPRANGSQPHGPGLANWCFWPVWLKRTNYRAWAVALERFATPTAIARVRANATKEEEMDALQTMAALAAGTSLVVHEGTAIEILESARKAGGDYAPFAKDMDRMIAEAIIGQHGTSEIGPHVGTGEVHMKVLERLVTADARRACDALRGSIATWLTHWNFPGAAVPRLRRDTAPPEDLESRARRDVAIAAASGLRPTQKYVEEVYGGEWEPAPTAPMTAPGEGETPPVAALAALAAPPATALDSLTDQLITSGLATEAAAPMLAPIDAALSGATSLADMRTRLDELESRPPPQALSTLLARADFAAGLAGVSGAPVIGEGLIEETGTGDA